MFRRTSLDAYNGALGIAPVADPASARFVLALRCERVHMAGDRGVCMAAARHEVADVPIPASRMLGIADAALC